MKTAINGCLQLFQNSVAPNVMGGSELTNKIFGYSERNVTSAFEFAQRVVQARNVDELASLQMEFVKAQMQVLTEEAKDLSETVAKAVMDSLKAPTKGGLSS